MKHNKIIVIGAGAAGLAAAGKLQENGYMVTILEARNRAGGRIDTQTGDTGIHLEGGAEFIHGKLPVTLKLLKGFNIAYHKAKGNWYRVKNGKVEKADAFVENYKLLEQHLKNIKEDISVQDFLEFHFPGDECLEFKSSVRNFVEGYDAADASKASTLHFKEEWLKDDDEQQYRIDKGYRELVDAMLNDFQSKGGKIIFNCIAREIHYDQKFILTSENNKITADSIIVTLPPPMLFDHRRKASVTFFPDLPEYSKAASQLGFGTVIKIIISFHDRFWESEMFKNAGWFLSEEVIPTWWTQLPVESNFLTGWIAGPEADKISAKSNDEITELAFQSLSTIFSLRIEDVKSIADTVHIFNWKHDPYSAGAYSYAALNRLKHLHLLNQPVNNTLYFAGEALEETHTGTIEAALASGFKAAHKIMDAANLI